MRFSQEVTFHGGPLHKQACFVAPYVNEVLVTNHIFAVYESTEEAIDNINNPVDIEKSLYTRVHHRGLPTNDFEWVGKISDTD